VSTPQLSAGAAVDLNATALRSDGFTVTWSPPADAAAQPSAYIVSVLRVGAASAAVQTTSFTALRVDALQPNSSYNVSVQARNAVGAALPVSIAVRTPPAGPIIIDALAEDGGGQAAFGAGDTVTLSFSAATDQRALSAGWLRALPPLNLSAWTGSWRNASALLLTAAAGADQPAVGVTRFIASSPLSDASGVAPVSSTAPFLRGQWGATGATGTASLAGTSARSTAEDTRITGVLSLVRVADTLPTRTLTLRVAAARGTLVRSGVNASSLDIDGTAAALNATLAGGGVDYVPAANDNGQDLLSLTLIAGGTVLAADSIAVGITPGLSCRRPAARQCSPWAPALTYGAVNDAPVWTVPAWGAVPQSGLVLAGLALTDADVPDSAVDSTVVTCQVRCPGAPSACPLTRARADRGQRRHRADRAQRLRNPRPASGAGGVGPAPRHAGCVDRCASGCPRGAPSGYSRSAHWPRC
jgi:hypothetical protein